MAAVASSVTGILLFYIFIGSPEQFADRKPRPCGCNHPSLSLIQAVLQPEQLRGGILHNPCPGSIRGIKIKLRIDPGIIFDHMGALYDSVLREREPGSRRACGNIDHELGTQKPVAMTDCLKQSAISLSLTPGRTIRLTW